MDGDLRRSSRVMLRRVAGDSLRRSYTGRRLPFPARVVTLLASVAEPEFAVERE
jgi:hypothetical protein